MRNIIIAVVAILALTVAGVGGTLASWSDSETSYDNYIETGSIDLKVQGTDDKPWGVGVDPKVQEICVQPCEEYYFEVPVRNDGQCEEASYLYVHFKDVCSCDAIPLHDSVIDDTGARVPEPEAVAEFGGIVDCTEVPGLGKICLMDHTDVTITFDHEVVIGPVKMSEIASEELFVGMLEPCGVEHIVDFIFHVQQISEDDAVDLGLLDAPVFGVGNKWYYWPSNALMKDILSFSIEFDLFKHELP